MEVVDSSSFHKVSTKPNLNFCDKNASLLSKPSYSLNDLSSSLSSHFNLRQELAVNNKRPLNEGKSLPKDLKEFSDGFKKVKMNVLHHKESQENLNISIEDNDKNKFSTRFTKHVPWKTRIEGDVWKIDPVICQKYLQIELKPISPKKDLLLMENMKEQHEKLKAKLWEKYIGNKVWFLPVTIENQQFAKALEQAIKETPLMNEKDNRSECAMIEKTSTSFSSALLENMIKEQENDVVKTRVGKAYQACILPFNLNHTQRVKKHCIKKVWEPEKIMSQEDWERYCEKISNIIGEKVTKEDALIKHLVKFNGDWEAALKEVEKFKIYYKSFFWSWTDFLKK